MFSVKLLVLFVTASGVLGASIHQESKSDRACGPTSTTVSGSFAPGQVCAGDLIFSDDFNDFNLRKWGHEITLSGGGNWEFQAYVNNRSNSFVENGKLFIRPTLTSEQFGEPFLSSGVYSLLGGSPADECTNPSNWGCERTGTPVNIVNPIKSARLRTVDSFNFRYGKVEVNAKVPAGDWLWPAIWLLPRYNSYSSWPASGEIDIMESRGNRQLTANNVNIGTHQSASTLHFGPYYQLNGYLKAHYEKNEPMGLNTAFHKYQVEWTPEHIKFSVDDAEIGVTRPPAGGFWELGAFQSQNPTADNPWKTRSKMAPFDQQFYIILNLAVGGTNGYFPDTAVNPKPKPWKNNSPQALLDFWNGRGDWLPTWKMNENRGADSSLQVDYVKVWAL